MKFVKAIVLAIFSIFDRQEKLPRADFGTADRAEERERDRRFLANL